MKKEDLKNGMVVEIEGLLTYGDTAFFLVLNNTLVNFGDKIDLNRLTKNLEFISYSDSEKARVVRVYKIKNITTLDEITYKENLELIWNETEEIDWNKVPRDIPVRVKNLSDVWQERKFIYYDDFFDFPFVTTSSNEYGVNCWKYCEIVGEIKKEWLK